MPAHKLVTDDFREEFTRRFGIEYFEPGKKGPQYKIKTQMSDMLTFMEAYVRKFKTLPGEVITKQRTIYKDRPVFLQPETKTKYQYIEILRNLHRFAILNNEPKCALHINAKLQEFVEPTYE